MSSDQFADPAAARLAQAASAGDAAEAKRLIADGANPNAANADGTPLLQRMILQGDRRGFETLLDAGADPASGSDSGNTAVHVAAMQDDGAWLETLLARGADADTPNTKNGETPLYAALEARNDANMQRLIDAGARVDAADAHGGTLLHKAARINATDWVVRLLEAGVDPNAKDRVGVTFQPSFFRARDAVLSGDAKRDRATVRAWLTERGIPVEARND
ncbi:MULTISPECIES: ankyrin repeat domain-containing protein [Luteimonas]|uniref:ankyrin repeat domain-containing protein n=1 Tax=Luteimonas TaxID=83614 RepID=UPI001304464C|nr:MULTISPECIES: ankyrin repeat domain-containing protein [Luteimonas]